MSIDPIFSKFDRNNHSTLKVNGQHVPVVMYTATQSELWTQEHTTILTPIAVVPATPTRGSHMTQFDQS